MTTVQIPTGRVTLEGELEAPDGARGVVLFAHGSGSSRRSPRNCFVAATLQRKGLATLLLDLLTPEEERVDEATRDLRFDLGLLAARLVVGGDDVPVIAFNREAMTRIRAFARREIIPGAPHLFEEPGALDAVAALAGEWFSSHLEPAPRGAIEDRRR